METSQNSTASPTVGNNYKELSVSTLQGNHNHEEFFVQKSGNSNTNDCCIAAFALIDACASSHLPSGDQV